MNIMFLGVPSSGKGTQAEFVRKKYKLAHLSIGELLRKKLMTLMIPRVKT